MTLRLGAGSLVALLSACSAGTVEVPDFERQFGVSVSSVPVAGEDALAKDGMASLLTRLRAAVGTEDPEVGDVHVNPHGISLIVRDPQQPKNMDWYYVHADRADPPRPESRSVSTALLSTLEPALARISETVALAIVGTDYTLNHVTGITLEVRGAAEPILAVSLSDLRNNTLVRFTPDGQRLP